MEYRAKVLIVDDEALIREALSEGLKMEGYEVDCAGNGQEALDYLRSHSHPDIIILDLMMPVMNGEEFRIHQLADERMAEIPVIVITGARDVVWGPLGSVAARLDKPVRLAEVVEYVELIVAVKKAGVA